MQSNNKAKPGLADLKRLRQQADTPAAPTKPPPARRKRRFQMPKSPGAVVEKVSAPSTPVVAPNAPLPVPAEDQALFRQAVKTVHPLPPANRALLPPTPVAPPAMLKQRRLAAAGAETQVPPPVADQAAPAALIAPDASHFVQTGYGADLLKELTRGKWPIVASLDLHGATLDEARERLDGFLRSCLQHRIRCVRIVHGKGHGSRNNAPVLKETVRRWLTQLEDVVAFVECAERDGGAGAVQVLLKAAD